MLGAGKKADDREGHKKAPPPAKPRPEDRRRPPQSAKQVPVGRLEGARRTGIQGGTSRPGWLLERRKSAAFVPVHGLRRLIDVTARVLVALGRQVACAGPLSRPGVRLVLLLIGAMAAVSAAARLLTSGFDRDGALAAAVATVALFLAALPFLLGAQKRSLPDGLRTGAEAVRRRLSRLRSLSVAARRGVVIAVLIGAAGVGWFVWQYGAPIARVASLPGFSAKTLEGRAIAMTGDTVRIGGTTVRLAGIEAPERDQRCTWPGNRRWPCGEAAVEALSRSVRGVSIRCEIRGNDNAGRRLGTCYAQGKDIAATLVREGHVFASGGLFASYGSLESEARANKAGIWRGEAERPSDYRAKIWDAAKRAAPDGCPIKGQVSASGKFYVAPWSPEYARIRVRPVRGERWFCSEEEAQAAGWKPAELD